jgi:hypothetical protein
MARTREKTAGDLVRPAVGRRRGPGGELLGRALRPRQQVGRRRVGLPHRRRPLHLPLPASSSTTLLLFSLSLSLFSSGAGEVTPLSLSLSPRRARSLLFLSLKRQGEVGSGVESNGRKVRGR